jgi:hypothetical protein
MDLQQRKLTKSEWESIETPVSSAEIEILNLIAEGYSNVNIKYNKTNSILSYLKIEFNDQLEDYIYTKFFSNRVNALISTYNASFLTIKVRPSDKLKKAYLIRMERHTPETLQNIVIYENILLEHIEKIMKYKHKNNNKWELHYFTLYKLMQNKVTNINTHMVEVINQLLKHYEDEVSIERIIENASEYIEKNQELLKYSDMMLYEHQKEVFTICKNKFNPKLVLYIAPTGTGKTLTPLGLLKEHKVIFVCAARHVGLALAKSAISIHKKVAFAFGCDSADDIRLHYFAAKDYTTNWKSGGIWKVDNSVGDKVELMICDIKSYLSAMYYMMSFNSKENIITYWDEPTITLDYAEHEFHAIIQKNWQENLIPNMILSSATLPKLNELPNTIINFREKFPDASTAVHNIVSHDCRKSIPILNKNGHIVLPHYISDDYDKVAAIAAHCENYQTLLRYFDLNETAKFIAYVNKNNFVSPIYTIRRAFDSLDDITMTNIKLYYLRLLKNIPRNTWGSIYTNLYNSRTKRIPENNSIDSKGTIFTGAAAAASQTDSSGSFATFISTKDAYTLTDGPTIYLANDVDKIAKFCIQQANIPELVMTDILESIEFNNRVNDKIEKLQKDLEDALPKEKQQSSDAGAAKKGGEKTKKIDRALDSSQNAKIKKELDMYQGMIKVAQLNDTFVPNKQAHLKKWAENMHAPNAFASSISEDTIVKIMMLTDVSNSWKILLMMGIGVFTNHTSIAYTEIMKQLADEQKLYLIIASSDYIYGTNYQFCHGYISKDMSLTQEKIIQALGRVGRNGIQQEYTIRLRDESQILKLFTAEADKPEVLNMNRLFCGSA